MFDDDGTGYAYGINHHDSKFNQPRTDGSMVIVMYALRPTRIKFPDAYSSQC